MSDSSESVDSDTSGLEDAEADNVNKLLLEITDENHDGEVNGNAHESDAPTKSPTPVAGYDSDGGVSIHITAPEDSLAHVIEPEAAAPLQGDKRASSTIANAHVESNPPTVILDGIASQELTSEPSRVVEGSALGSPGPESTSPVPATSGSPHLSARLTKPDVTHTEQPDAIPSEAIHTEAVHTETGHTEAAVHTPKSNRPAVPPRNTNNRLTPSPTATGRSSPLPVIPSSGDVVSEPAQVDDEAPSSVLPPDSTNPRLVNPRRPARKGVKPPTRGAPVAFKLTTKTDTDNVQAPPPAPIPLSLHSNTTPSASLSAPELPVPRSGSPNLAARAGPGGVPNFAAQALNVQLKKTAAVKKPLENSASAPIQATGPPPVPPKSSLGLAPAKAAPVAPPVPPRQGRVTRSHTTGEMPAEIKEEGKEGYLHKRGGIFKGWKKRWFVLKEGKIYYYSSQKTDAPKGVIADVYKVDKQPSKDKEFCFNLYSPKRTYQRAP